MPVRSLYHPYIDGAAVERANPCWEVWDEQGNCVLMPAPRQFRHTLGTVVNGLIQQGFVILGLWEEIGADPGAAPGTWDHFTRIAPPIFAVWSRYRPDLLPLV